MVNSTLGEWKGLDGCELNIVFKKKVSPYGHMSDDHNALGNGLEKLDKVLTKAGIPTLGQFVSCDPEEWMDMDDEDPDAEGCLQSNGSSRPTGWKWYGRQCPTSGPNRRRFRGLRMHC